MFCKHEKTAKNVAISLGVWFIYLFSICGMSDAY